MVETIECGVIIASSFNKTLGVGTEAYSIIQTENKGFAIVGVVCKSKTL